MRVGEVGVVDDGGCRGPRIRLRAGRAPAPRGSGRSTGAGSRGRSRRAGPCARRRPRTGTSSQTDQSHRSRSSGRCRKIPSTMSTASRGAVTHSELDRGIAVRGRTPRAGTRSSRRSARRRGTGRSARGGRWRSRTSRGRSPRGDVRPRAYRSTRGRWNPSMHARNTVDPSSAKTAARPFGEHGLARAVDAVDRDDDPARPVVVAHLVAQLAPQGRGGRDRQAHASSLRSGRRGCSARPRRFAVLRTCGGRDNLA